VPIHHFLALNSVTCADVPLTNYSLLTHSGAQMAGSKPGFNVDEACVQMLDSHRCVIR